MQPRSVKQLVKAQPAHEGDLVLYQPLPTAQLRMLDPFLLLHHHGPHKYEPNNAGLPFGPHPHRGFEAVTFIFDGSVEHHDSRENRSTIHAGGVQWMTAARGIVHSENVPKEFREKGGTMEIIQLWINLPAQLKMSQPNYQGVQKENIPTITFDNGKAAINVVAGNLGDVKGAVNSITGIQAYTINLKAGGTLALDVEENRDVLLYVLHGAITANGLQVKDRTLAHFENDGTSIHLEAAADTLILFCSGAPIKEKVMQYGPFVMTTQSEIMEAMRDYQMGKMGVLVD
ncbi:MAG: pirin family protein [Chitinophagales bacterium]|nr:pirin family protein [Chitinophagales bacterium]